MAKYTKTKSKYFSKKAHSMSDAGIIFEQELSTNNDIYYYSNENLIIGGGDGVSLVTNTQESVSKTYNKDYTSETFTLNDFIDELREEKRANTIINHENTVVTQKNAVINNSIKLKKNYFDLTKIAYYGSCQSHIKSAIEGIILTFPSSLYVTNKTAINNNVLTIPLSAITNPFLIDIADYNAYDRSTMPFDLKVLSTSFTGYTVGDSDNVEYANVMGFTNDGSNLIFSLDNNVNIAGNFHIKPNKKYIDRFFNSLSGVQVELLNRHTQPKFKSKFKTIEETEDGISYRYIDFTWKTYDGYNLDISSIDYLNFVDELIRRSEYVDQNFSDNIYRMLTHETLKSMDNSYIQQNRLYLLDGDMDDVLDGETKIQKLLRLYGRHYDNIKEYIDEVSYVNNISYNKKENINDVYLQDKLSYMGWNVTKLTNTLPITSETSTNIYPAVNGKLSLLDVEHELNRRFVINSKNIFKSKGTKKSIRKIFGMLGIDSEIYDIREYSQDITNYITGETLQKIIELNGQLRTNEFENPFTKNGLVNEDISSYGLNLKTFIKCPICGELDYVTNFAVTNENTCSKTNIPIKLTDVGDIQKLGDYEWQFTGANNDANVVFRIPDVITENGWWTVSFDLRTSQSVVFPIVIDICDKPAGSANTTNDNKYKRVSFSAYVDNHTTGIYNFIDINCPTYAWYLVRDIKIEKGETATPWSPSIQDQDLLEYGVCIKNKHAFVLTGNTFAYPSPRNNGSGYYFQQMGSWYRETGGVHLDINGNTQVVDIMDGNNPHIGNGYYDYGTSYIDNFKQIFKTDIISQLNNPNIDINAHKDYGFNLLNKKTIDNNKIVFTVDSILTDEHGDNILTDGGEIIYVDYDNLDAKLRLNLKNFVIGINSKRALEQFTNNNTAYTGGLTEDAVFQTIKKIVLPYIENIIPSTTIFEFVNIDKTTPKWQLVENYPERTGETQNYSGKTILRYKNVNYYDEITTGATQELFDLIEKDFGNMFVQYGGVVGSGFDMEILFIGDNDQYEKITTPEWEEANNLFNFLTL